MNITQEQLEQVKGGQAVEIAENGDEFVLIRKDMAGAGCLLKKGMVSDGSRIH